MASAGGVPGRVEPSTPRALAVVGLCPYLTGEAGFRSLSPSRRHRCGAVPETTPVAVEKQRRLCLTPLHVECATFQAARGLDADPEAAGDDARVRDIDVDGAATAWAFSRGSPVLLESSAMALPVISFRPAANLWQAGLASLMVVAFAVLFMSRLTGPGPQDGGLAIAGADGTPAVAGITGRPSATARSLSAPSSAPPAATPVATAAPSSSTPPASATASPPASAAPSGPATTPRPAARTYTVQSGDTLSAIAGRFGTTVDAIVALNDLADPSLLSIGQVLRIP